VRLRRLLGGVLLVSWLVATAGPAAAAAPSDPPVETPRASVLRAVYFPFLALGHGLLLLGKYGVAYPIWFVFKPVYDTLYESSEDPRELSAAAAQRGSSSSPSGSVM
jgi:hypothetical protein